MPEITITVTDEVAARLAALADPGSGHAGIAGVVAQVVDHVQQGVYRAGAWERGVVRAMFGDDWLERLAPDDRPEMLSGDGHIIFDRPADDRGGGGGGDLSCHLRGLRCGEPAPGADLPRRGAGRHPP